MISSLLTPLMRGLIEVGGAIAPTPLPSAYVANGFEPKFVADFSALSADYFRVAGNDSTFAEAFTDDSYGGGLATMTDSSGNLVWRAHNLLPDPANGGANSNVTVTPGASDPDGGTSAFNVVQSGSNCQLGQSVVVALGDQYTMVVTIKVNTGRWVRVLPSNVVVFFDADNAFALGSTSAGYVTSSVQDLGGGWYRVTVVGEEQIGGLRQFFPATIQTADGSSTELDGADFDVYQAHAYRSDLGGMANNPDTGTTYVPTTTAARFLARRRHHRWDGSAWVPTCLHEPVGPVTNECNQSRLFDGTGDWVVNAGLLNTKNAVGIDGVANSATTIEDDSAVAYEFLDLASTVTSDTARRGFSCYFKKTTSATTYPALGLEYGGATVRGVTIDTNNGTLTDRATLGPDASYIEDAGDFWRVSIFHDNTSQTAFTIYIYAAVNSDGSGTWTPTAGSAVIDQVDLYLAAGTSLPSSPIITNGSTQARTADTLKGKAASLPYSSVAISMAVKGRYDAAVWGGNDSLLSWYQDGTNYLLLYVLGVSGSREPGILLRTGATLEQARSGDNYASNTGVGIEINAALRAVASSAVQAASRGTAGGEETATVPTMPALIDDDLAVSTRSAGNNLHPLNGTVDTIRLWDEDVGTTGITEATS